MRLLKSFEKIYLVVSLLFFAQAIIQRATAEGDTSTDAQLSQAFLLGQALIYAILLPLLFVHWKKLLRGLQESRLIIALCAVVVLSALSANAVVLTARRGVLLSLMTLFAIYAASCFELDEQLSLFGWMSVIVIFGSTFMAIFVPEFGISHDLHAGAVKGLFPHKNILGRQMVFAILVLAVGKPLSIPSWLRNSCLVFGCVLLILSKAATSILALGICVAMYPIFLLLRVPTKKTLPLWVSFLPVMALGVGALFVESNVVLELLGKNSTLTGRTAIWGFVLRSISNRPLFGYGYESFWNVRTPELAKLALVTSFHAPHAHNGFLDILLAVGIIGMLVFLAGYIGCLRQSVHLFQHNQIRAANWPLFGLLFFTLLNCAESYLLRPLTFMWIPYVTIYVSLGLLKTKEKHKVTAKPAWVSTGVQGLDRTSEAACEYGL